MSQVNQVQDDLRFVREAVTRRERSSSGPPAIYWVWAVYVLIGYTLLDLSTSMAGWFFMIGGFAGGALSAWIGSRYSRQTGQVDSRQARRSGLHFGGGIVLAYAFTLALEAAIPQMRGPQGGQVLVVMIGLIYFLAGVHLDANMLWLGPVLMIGGVVVGFVPHYGWTCLGAIIALGLVVPTILPSRRRQSAGEQLA